MTGPAITPDDLPVLPVPRIDDAAVAIAPPGSGSGFWVGCAQRAAGRRRVPPRLPDAGPAGAGPRAWPTSSRAQPEGVRFEPVAEVTKDRFGAESLERPALVRTPQGRWRLYVSCATPGTKHWWVDVLEADTPEGLADAPRRTVLPGERPARRQGPGGAASQRLLAPVGLGAPAGPSASTRTG